MSESYLPTHEWARIDGGVVVIGLSPFAAGEVGDVIHVQLPKVGTAVKRGVACAEIESVKSVNDYYSPVDGTVTEVNAELANHPELVNQAPLAAGWFVKIKAAGAEPLAGLLTAAQYATQTKK